MNRDTYLKELDHYLRKLPREDYENAMDYFTEYFDEAGPEREAEVIQELGAPREAAAELLNELLTSSNLPVPYQKTASDGEDKEQSGTAPQKKEEKKAGFFGDSSAGRIVLIALLAIIAAPVGIPLAIGALSVLFGGVLMVVAVFACVVAVGLTALFIGGWFIYNSLMIFASSVSAGILIVGSGLLGIGLGLLIILFAIWAGRQMIFGLARLISRLISKKGGEKHD